MSDRRRDRWVIVALASCLLVVTSLAAAQAPERVESFVYATTHFDGAGYSSGLATPDVQTMYLLADVENVIAPRRTLVYYWPLTNEFLADWARQNDLVEGTLEVLQAGRVLTEVPLTDFVIQYDSDDILGTVTLISGTNAQTAFDAFEQAQARYREDLFAHAREEQAWREELREITRNNAPGTVDPNDLPVRPEAPPPLTQFSTDLISGYVLSLPVGEYCLRMRLPDGTVQPGSEKRLVTFRARREGVAYEVTPQSRWTRPEESRNPQSVIYAQPGTTVYLRPYTAREYNTRHYTNLNNPQSDVSRADQFRWVLQQPLTDASAQIQRGGGMQAITMTPFYVRQLATDSRGYDIIPWDPSVSEQPSFDGFPVEIPVDGAVVLQLVDADGNAIPGSRREIRPLYAGRTWLPYTLAAMPLLLGVGVISARRRGTRRVSRGSASA